ncbi:MAG: valine--tRNA ligase, partial [Pseudomonadota bacterium]
MTMDKTFNAAEAERRLYNDWERAGCFVAGANAKPGAETYCIMIPPPNVTGSLHIGHAFNNTLQDILIRWKRMQGFDTLWQPGMDHAGIATQMVVERQLAAEGDRSRREMGRAAFIKRVWEQRHKSGGAIIEQLKRLGASCDWTREAFTMGEEGIAKGFPEAVIRVFVDFHNRGLIHRGKQLVNWDPYFETAISDLEVENIEVDGRMWHFKYPLADGETYIYAEKDESGNVLFEEERAYISIATTRPETMLGDGAVAVHPSDERYAPIVGKFCEIPVGPKAHRRLIPIITDDYPDPDFGSGAVKITGAHDFNDYGVAQRNGIPMYRLMNTKGAMRTDGAPYREEVAKAQAIVEDGAFDDDAIDAVNLVPDAYRGLDRFEARRRVVADITAEGLAVMTTDAEGNRVALVENRKITQPFGDRSKTVIEPMLTDQWFVDAARIVQPAIDAVCNGETRILPEQHKKVYLNWLENIEPWCISRQLWWGHRIPVWYGPDKDDITASAKSFCAANEEEVLKLAKRYYGPEIRLNVDDGSEEVTEGVAFETLQDPDGAKRLTHVSLTRDPDVLDTWFSSGLWPIGALGWPEKTEALARYFPTNTLITAFDIIFFWVARMMMMQYAVVGEKPFDTVYVHALVRDEKGKKMSKSLGNVLDPIELVDEFGADAVRFTLTAMAVMGRDLKVSKQRIAGYRNFGTKLWNATRFAQMNGVFEAHATHPFPALPPEAATATVNKWMIGEVAKVREDVDRALENFRFNDAAAALYAFVWGKVCDWYVEFSKPLLQGEDAGLKRETQQTMAWILDQCFILLHPIMPFITEELWGLSAHRDKMLIHADWPTYKASDLLDETSAAEMNWVISLIENIRSVRAEMGVPAGVYIPMLQLELSTEGQTAWARNEALIKRLAHIASLDEAETAPKGAVTITIEGGTFCLPLADVIDVAVEKERLKRSLDKIEKELGGLRKRLTNPSFLTSAPKEVVEETRENLTVREEREIKIKAALARLAEL